MKLSLALLLGLVVSVVDSFVPINSFSTGTALRLLKEPGGQLPSSGETNNQSKKSNELWVTTAHHKITHPSSEKEESHSQFLTACAAVVAASSLLVVFPETAAAADGTALSSALAAYAHYFSLLVAIACLTTEKLTIKAAMTPEEENRLTVVDSVYGVAGLGLVISGYLRVTQYGKGWDFYSHEPIFWLKMALLAVAGAASFFPTTIIIKRALEMRNSGSVPPMSEALAARMTTLVNAELLAFLSIPLAATTMSRGIGYMDGFPWQAGAGVAVLALGGFGYKYVREAFDWQEPEEVE